VCEDQKTSRLLLDQITDKWTILILTVLCKGPLRFNKIKRNMDGITQKSLTQCLRRLERNGIVCRRVIPTSQVGVEYSITPLGRTLETPFQALYRWALDYSSDVSQAQEDFDRRNVG